MPQDLHEFESIGLSYRILRRDVVKRIGDRQPFCRPRPLPSTLASVVVTYKRSRTQDCSIYNKGIVYESV